MRTLLVCATLLLASCDNYPQSTSVDPLMTTERIVTPFASPDLFRTKVPGGWLVWTQKGGIVVVNDPDYKWSIK